jgi:O-antigen/teichoic acid export membrane protein
MKEESAGSGISLTSGRRLLRNVVWNGAGEIGPLIAAFVAMPILIHELGTELFGVLALAWTVFGYFTLFDFGTSAALTKLLSDRLARRAESEIPALIGTALGLVMVFGLISAGLLEIFAHLMATHLFRVAPGMQAEVARTFYLMALALPICLALNACVSILAAYQRFDLINLVQSPNAIFSSLGPLAVLPFSHSIVLIVGTLVGGSVVASIVCFALCIRVVPRLIERMRLSAPMARELIEFGKWAAGYRVTGTLMLSFDRFVLASVTSMSALSYYVVPGRILNKLRLVPWSVARVVFPAMSYSLGEDRAKSRVIFERSAKALLLVMFPAALILVAFAYELLSLWVGAAFAAQSSVLLQWLAVAAFLYALGSAPDELLWAAHRPDLTLKLRSVELPLYLALMFAMVYWRGAEGAAIACAVRCGAESATEWIIARIILPDVARGGRRLGYFAVAAGLGLALAAMPAALPIRIAIVAAELLGLLAAGWWMLLDREERGIVMRSVRGSTETACIDRGEAA